MKTFTKEENEINCLDVCPDLNKFVTGGSDVKIWLYDDEKGVLG